VSDPNGRHYTLANSALFTLVRYISDPPAHIRREELIEGVVGMAERLLGSDDQPRRLSKLLRPIVVSRILKVLIQSRMINLLDTPAGQAGIGSVPVLGQDFQLDRQMVLGNGQAGEVLLRFVTRGHGPAKTQQQLMHDGFDLHLAKMQADALVRTAAKRRP
jgi:hypothetical protein